MRAGLRATYGIDLREVTQNHTIRPLDLADYALWLPAGSPLWMDVGGPVALTMEQRELRRVTYWLRVLDYRQRGSKGTKPEPDPEPEYAHERRLRQAAVEARAAAYRRRHARGD